jgi:hypothetical protein
MPQLVIAAATYYGAELVAAEFTKAFIIGLANSGGHSNRLGLCLLCKG